jgi:hypothetical protein
VSARIQLSGFDELKAALRRLPDDLTAEAGHITEAAANAAAVDIRRAYPVRTGNLRNHVTVTHFEKGRFSAGAIVKNTATHAWIFENGTQARHTDLGSNRGSMPPGHVFVPIAIRERRRMYDRLKDLLARRGLVVDGNA